MTDEISFIMKTSSNCITDYCTTYQKTYNALALSTESSLNTCKQYTTKEICEKRRNRQGIKIFHNNHTNPLTYENHTQRSIEIPSIRRIQLPPSQRVFDYNLRPHEETRAMKSYKSQQKINSFTPGNFEALLAKTWRNGTSSITGCRRTPNSKLYKSYDVFAVICSIPKSRKMKSETKYSEYERTSQVVSLPGAIKRDSLKIKDDQKVFKKNNPGYLFKVDHDYFSQIDFGNQKIMQISDISSCKGRKRIPEREMPIGSIYNMSYHFKNEGFGIPSRMNAKQNEKRHVTGNKIFKSQWKMI